MFGQNIGSDLLNRFQIRIGSLKVYQKVKDPRLPSRFSWMIRRETGCWKSNGILQVMVLVYE